MSLALLQSYSSAEEDEVVNDELLLQDQISSDDEATDAVPKTRSYKPLFDPNPRSSSPLPSAFDAFSEVNIDDFRAKVGDPFRFWNPGLNQVLIFFVFGGGELLEIAGPPQFLNNSVEEDPQKGAVQQWRHGSRKNRKDKRHLPSGEFIHFQKNFIPLFFPLCFRGELLGLLKSCC